MTRLSVLGSIYLNKNMPSMARLTAMLLRELHVKNVQLSHLLESLEGFFNACFLVCVFNACFLVYDDESSRSFVHRSVSFICWVETTFLKPIILWLLGKAFSSIKI